MLIETFVTFELNCFSGVRRRRYRFCVVHVFSHIDSIASGRKKKESSSVARQRRLFCSTARFWFGSAQELPRLTLAGVCVAARVGPRNRVRVKCFYRWCENVLLFLTQYKMMALKIKTDAEAN